RIVERPRDPVKLAADVHEMRVRLLEAKPAAGPWDVKLAEGGLTELEFVLAFLTLKEGASARARPQGASPTVRFLADRGVIDRNDAQDLLTASELFETVMQVA